uniref:Small humanin-like peptide 3 n=1 Tax=Homo sapiens TaxID=9606 RepID=SHLP3_HUMAN|nr:SHLP3 [Homo sapiens]
MLGYNFSSFPCGTISIAPGFNFYRLYFIWVNGLAKVVW